MATGVAAGRGRGGRFSAGRKREVVMRLLRGEDLESVSRAVGITVARASHWRAQFLAAGQAGLKSRAPDARDEDHRRLQAKLGELLMETELLYAKVDQLEAGGPLARAEVDAMSGAPVDLHPSGVWRAAGLPRVAPRPLQCVCAAAGDTVSCAVSSPRADRRCPGRRPGGPHSPGARSLAVSWRGLPKSLGEAAGRGDAHLEGAGAPVDARARPPSPAARGPRAWGRRRTTGPSPPRRPT